MKAVYGKVVNTKKFPSMGQCRLEIELPVEKYKDVVALLDEQRVLVTIAPDALSTAPYGVIEAAEPPKTGQLAGRLAAHLESAGPAPAPDKPPEDYQAPAAEPSPPLGPRALWAVLRCKEPEFHKFLSEEFPDEFDADDTDEESAARATILSILDIESRRDLDIYEDAGSAFDELIRRPYSKRSGG